MADSHRSSLSPSGLSPRGRNSRGSGSSTNGVPAIVASAIESDSDAVSLKSVASTASSAIPPSSPVIWTHITLGALVQSEKLYTVETHSSVENAFNILQKKDLTCVPVQQSNGVIVDTFDYADLTGYLLLVLGHITVKGQHSPEFAELLAKAREGIPAPVEFAAQFGAREPFVRMSTSMTLASALQKFASGVHRIALVDGDNSEKVVGILSQRRMIRYIWNNLKRFPALDAALDKGLDDLHIGTYGEMITVQGDAPVLEALDIMHEKSVSSVAVVDKEHNLLGNISVVDVALLTRAWQAGLLRESCRHFLTVVLDSRGIKEGGNEVVPVFFVHKHTKLGKVLAKMVATRAHRLWITEDMPQTDPEVVTSGQLVGVVSLTDILNFVARQQGQTLDPETARRHRRSSSSSVRSDSRVRHQILMEGSPVLERPRLSFDRPRR